MDDISYNHYETLRLPRDADKNLIKRAYFKLVKEHTPEKSPERFRTIRDAYETLIDDKKRKSYDILFADTGRFPNELAAIRQMIRQKKTKPAIEKLTKLDEAHPNNTEIELTLALAYQKNGNSGKSQRLCEKIISREGKNQCVMYLMAKASEARGHKAKADGYYEEAIALSPTAARPWADRIRFLFGYDPLLSIAKMNEAFLISEDMFKDDYALYIQVAYVSGRLDMDKELVKYSDKFTELFLADAHPDPKDYNSAVTFLEHMVSEGKFVPCIKKLLPALLESGYRQPEHEFKLEKISERVTLSPPSF